MLNPLTKKQIISEEEYIRYARQIIIKNICREGQEKLKQAKIICIGAGGLNATALLYLVSCGVGTVGVIDDDTIEISNLQRQILYSSKEIGKQKTKIAYKTLKCLNPMAKIEIYHKYLNYKNIEQTLEKYDIIIDGTDKLKIRYLISWYCYKFHKIHIYGAIEGFIGHISVFNYKNSPHYYNLYQDFTQRNYNNCNNSGIINTLAGIIGTMQATEAIKIITGIGSTTYGYLLVFNILNYSLHKTKIKSGRILKTLTIKNKKYKHEYASRISIKNIEQKIRKKYQLIDIRSSREFKLENIENSINIPLRTLKTQKSIKRIEAMINQGYLIIVYCDHNTRSYIASQILNKYKIKHFILGKNLN